MNKLVTKVVDLLKIDTKVGRIAAEGYVGLIILIILFFVYFATLLSFIRIAEPLSLKGQEVFVIILYSISFVALVWWSFSIIKIILQMLITVIRFGLSPYYKNRADSIESIMTSDVEDRGRLHREIIKYLKEYSLPRDFAALYIWFSENRLMYTEGQKQFLTCLEADFPKMQNTEHGKQSPNQVSIPSESSLSEQKKLLEKDEKKGYRAYGYEKQFKKRFKDYIK